MSLSRKQQEASFIATVTEFANQKQRISTPRAQDLLQNLFVALDIGTEEQARSLIPALGQKNLRTENGGSQESGSNELSMRSNELSMRTNELSTRMSVSPSVHSVHSNGSDGCSSSNGSSGNDSNPTSPGLLVEHEDIIALTNFVKTFREVLSRLKRIFHPDNDKSETPRVQAHERLGEVLRILRTILERYPAIQSTELLMAAGNMIQRVKEYPYEEEARNVTDFFEAIDQLALAFSTRVSEYLMGDIDSNITSSSKTRLSSREKLVDSPEDAPLTPSECDDRFLKLPEGIDLALHRAKVWSKYAKDVMGYIEKRAQLEADHARNLAKLAHATKPLLREEGFLPFQAIYCTALDQDLENSNASLATSSLLLGHKFLEPLSSRRSEHERTRKQIKQHWSREMKRMQETVNGLRKAKAAYMQRQAEYDRAKGAAKATEGLSLGLDIVLSGSSGDPTGKMEKKRRLEDEAGLKAMEAENIYRTCVQEANERASALEKVKKELLVQIRELIYQCDQTMKAVTVSYFQLQHTISAPGPVQFHTLCESSRLYEPGAQYNEFIKRLPTGARGGRRPFPLYLFHSYTTENRNSELEDPMSGSRLKSVSDSESVESGEEIAGTDRRPSPHVNRSISSGDELELGDAADSGYGPALGSPADKKGGPPSPISRAAATHKLKKLKTPARCRECDSYVYFQGIECSECGLAVHKKCLESLHIKCGHKRLTRKMNTFGVALSNQKRDTVPYIVTKCISEIDDKGFGIKGLYRVSGVKSHVEKLCQSFENGAELVDLSDIHPNVIANVLKLYFRQLPEPLLTFRLYPEFIRVAKEFPASSKEHSPSLDSPTSEDTVAVYQFQEIAQLVNVVDKMPRTHYVTLSFLIHHLKRVANNHQENNMPSSNLGIVFGPTLLRTSEGGSSLSSLVDTVHQTRVIDMLITFANEVFGSPPKVDQKGAVEKTMSTPAVERIWPVVRSASQALIRSGKNLDFKELNSRNDKNEGPMPESNVQRAYSSSAIITLAGHKIITSSPSVSTVYNNNVKASVQSERDSKRPSINELRRQFFTEVTGPPTLPLTINFDQKTSTPADSAESDMSGEPSPTGFVSRTPTSTTLTQSSSFVVQSPKSLRTKLA